MTLEEAAKLVENPLYLACLMIKSGDADGEVAGARNITGKRASPGPANYQNLPGGQGRFRGLHHAYANTAIR